MCRRYAIRGAGTRTRARTGAPRKQRTHHIRPEVDARQPAQRADSCVDEVKGAFAEQAHSLVGVAYLDVISMPSSSAGRLSLAPVRDFHHELKVSLMRPPMLVAAVAPDFAAFIP